MIYFFIKNKKLLFFVIFYNYFITDDNPSIYSTKMFRPKNYLSFNEKQQNNYTTSSKDNKELLDYDENISSTEDVIDGEDDKLDHEDFDKIKQQKDHREPIGENKKVQKFDELKIIYDKSKKKYEKLIICLLVILTVMVFIIINIIYKNQHLKKNENNYNTNLKNKEDQYNILNQENQSLKIDLNKKKSLEQQVIQNQIHDEFEDRLKKQNESIQTLTKQLNEQKQLYDQQFNQKNQNNLYTNQQDTIKIIKKKNEDLSVQIKNLKIKNKELIEENQTQNNLIQEMINTNGFNELRVKEEKLKKNITELEQKHETMINNEEQYNAKQIQLQTIKSHVSNMENRHSQLLSAIEKFTKELQEKEHILNNIENDNKQIESDRKQIALQNQQLNTKKKSLNTILSDLKNLKDELIAQNDPSQGIQNKNIQLLNFQREEQKMELLKIASEIKQANIIIDNKEIEEKTIHLSNNIQNLFAMGNFTVDGQCNIRQLQFDGNKITTEIVSIYKNFSIFDKDKLFLFNEETINNIEKQITEIIDKNKENFNIVIRAVKTPKDIFLVSKFIIEQFKDKKIFIKENISINFNDKIFKIYILQYILKNINVKNEKIKSFINELKAINQQRISAFNQLFKYSKLIFDIDNGMNMITNIIPSYITKQLTEINILKTIDNDQLKTVESDPLTISENSTYETIINLLKNKESLKAIIELCNKNSIISDLFCSLEPHETEKTTIQKQQTTKILNDPKNPYKLNNNTNTTKIQGIDTKSIYEYGDKLKLELSLIFNNSSEINQLLHNIFQKIIVLFEKINNFIYKPNFNKKIIDLLKIKFNEEDINTESKNNSMTIDHNLYEIIQKHVKLDQQKKYINYINKLNLYYIHENILYVQRDQLDHNNNLLEIFQHYIEQFEKNIISNKNTFDSQIKKIEDQIQMIANDLKLSSN